LTLYPSGESYTEPVTTGFGEFDFVTKGDKGLRVALEWETGNISSSHRSVNKLCICLNAGVNDAGVVIVPSRELYTHITDRIGNINELSGYLSLWEPAPFSDTTTRNSTMPWEIRLDVISNTNAPSSTLPGVTGTKMLPAQTEGMAIVIHAHKITTNDVFGMRVCRNTDVFITRY